MSKQMCDGQKAPLGWFLRRNPFRPARTIGFFYREKMRAIHRVAPDDNVRDVLDIGGGRSGLASLLYPGSRIIALDSDPTFADDRHNRKPGVTFVCADATRLPFADASFDLVSMFDVIEHIPDDRRAICEALRVLRPGGHLLVTTPNERWKFPYYRFMKPLCPSDEEMIAEWGHVRRGYTLEQLVSLTNLPCQKTASFISPGTALAHDVSFSRLYLPVKLAVLLALLPLTWTAYALQKPDEEGTETAYAWRKPLEG